MTRERGPRPSERQPTDAWYGDARMPDDMLLRALKKAVGAFDTHQVEILARHAARVKQSTEEWDLAFRNICGACRAHSGDATRIPGMFDAILAGVGKETGNSILLELRDNGVVLGHLLRQHNNACEAWARSHHLPLRRDNIYAWLDSRMARLCEIDLVNETGWLVERSIGNRFNGMVVALGVLRGEDAPFLDDLIDALRLDDNSAIGEGMASVLYRRAADDDLQVSAATRATPSGLDWLRRKCPPMLLRKGARAIMMDDENKKALIEPMIRDMKAAGAILENERLEASTGPASGGRTGPRL